MRGAHRSPEPGAGSSPRKAISRDGPHLGILGGLAVLEKQACESQALPWQGSTGASEWGTAPKVQWGGDGDRAHGM